LHIKNDNLFMQPAISLLAVVPVRSEPSHRSEMVSQVLFGEYVTMGEKKDDFVAVQCGFDGYEGWVQASQLTSVADNQIRQPIGYLAAAIGDVAIDGRKCMIPFGAPVYEWQKAPAPLQFGNRELTYQLPEGAVWPVAGKPFTADTVLPIIELFLDTPYLWGGKSVFGTDCSGFVQQVLKLFSVKLLRDAYLQAEQGGAVSSLDEAAFGDLLFFQNEKGRVMHVGILLSENQIVHASGKVRIDTADTEGIINNETGEQTHRFHSIRRAF
jgi:hypothetical protein